MKILWVVNIPLPEASLLMKEKPLPFGGWLINASKILSEKEEYNLNVAFPKKEIKDVLFLRGNRIDYYAFSLEKDIKTDLTIYKNQLIEILCKVEPDIVHIFGTEHIHTLAMVNLCKERDIKTVISIQGLISVYAKHYMGYLPNKIQKRYTLRDILKHDNLEIQQKMFEERGKSEIIAIENVNHVIGRTTWDKACTTQINQNINYHFCNEILRDEFYNHEWSIDECEKYSIFISQASYPIKGLHLMFEALSIVLKNFENANLYIAGPNIIEANTLKKKFAKTSYISYIISLIKKYHLENNIHFTGILDEKQMCERYLKSNVFVCPSSIENSPNSLGEAMILGLPCIAADVGGISDLLIHKEEGFVYQADAIYMLAFYICEIFQNKKLAQTISKNARKHALLTHDRKNNTNQLIEIYKNIIKD